MNTATNKTTETRHEMKLAMPCGGETIVWFTPVGDMVRIYTWGVHTDYTTTFVEPVAVARESWRTLTGRGFKFVRSFVSEGNSNAVDGNWID